MDLAIADKIQTALDAFKTSNPTGTTEELRTALKTAMAAQTSTSSCGENFFEYFENSEAFETLVMTSDITTETWYKGKQYYDFATGKIVYPPGDGDEADKAFIKKDALAFTQMMWKGSGSVGLGVYSKYVVAWFCPTGNAPAGSAQDFVDNVSDVCLVPENPAPGEKQYDRCYNQAAVTYHNNKRALHRDTGFLEVDEDIAKWIQDKMESFVDFDAAFTGVIADKGAFYNCGENVFQETSASSGGLRFTDAASEGWYAGNKYYDESTGRSTDPTNASKTAEAFKFTKMVWRKTTRVGFGVKGKWVVAWYCESQPASNSPAAEFVRNVGAKCVDSAKVNVCYNELANAAHNERRTKHEASPLVWEGAIAAALQQAMDAVPDA